MSETQHTTTLDDLPPSALLAYKVLEYRGEMTTSEVIEHTRMPGRTVRYALNTLVDRGLAESRPNLRDTRVRIYSLRKARADGGQP